MTYVICTQCCHCFSPLKEDGGEDESAHSDNTDANKSIHSTFLTAMPGACLCHSFLLLYMYILTPGYDSNRSLQGNGTSREGIDVSSALKLISHEEGRKISGKAHSVVKDAYFAFLLLRHARIRDLMIKVLVISIK